VPRGGIIDADCIIAAASNVLSRVAASVFPCKHLALTLSGFVAREGKRDITSFFGAMAAAAAATAATAAAGCTSFGCSPESPSDEGAAASQDDELPAGDECDDSSDFKRDPQVTETTDTALCSHSSDLHLAPAAAALPSPPLPSASLAQAAVTKLAAPAVVDITGDGDEDECVIIEPLSSAVAPSLSSSAAASRQVRCPECSKWLVGDTALRLHADEHVAQKYQVQRPCPAVVALHF
jgi:hypothetical protein